MEYIVHARGHENISGRHKNTLMFTREDHLTLRGDCIIAVSADTSAASLPESFKEKLRRAGAKLTVTIMCEGITETIKASGSPNLTLTDDKDLVVRKSTFTCPRTLGVSSDKAAADLKPGLTSALSSGGEVLIKLKVD